MKYSLGIVLALSLILKAAASISLQTLWDYINSLQLVTLIPLMGVSLPPNLYALLSYISGPLSFNYLEESNLALKIFNLDPDEGDYEGYNEVFSGFGFQTKLAAVNLQDTVIYAAIFIFGFPFTLALQRIPFIKRFRITKYVSEKLTGIFMYGFVIRLFVENFMAIFMSCVMNFTESNRSTYGEITSLTFAVGLFICMILILFSVTFRMFRDRNDLDDDDIKNRIGSFYEDLRLDSIGALLYTPIYLLRRLIFCILALTLSDFPLA